MKSFKIAAAKVAASFKARSEDVERAALMAARGSDYRQLAKFLPKTDISVRAVRFPDGLVFLTTTDISVGAFDRPVHSRDSKGVGRARSNGRLSRKEVL